MNNRRRLLAALGAGALTVPFGSFGEQQGKVPRVAFLIAETISGQSNRIEALRTGLRDLGYVEGKNITIDLRSADGNYDRLPELAAELTGLKVDVIVAFGAKAVAAARGATSTIPIVIPLIGDPVAFGLTSNLARPSGNITGLSTMGLEVAGKRMELLKEVVPSIAHVAVLMNPATSAAALVLRAMRATGRALKIELQAFEVERRSEIQSAFSAMAKSRMNGLVVPQETLFIANAKEIADLAAKHKIPSVGNKEFAEAGGLIGYGTSDAELYHRGAYFVDRLIKGAKPGDLPFERAMKFEMVVNMKTAKTLNITIPQSVLISATKLIE